MLTEDYIVRMIRDMGQMLARVLGSQAWEPDRCAEVWEAAAGDCPPLLEELKALCGRAFALQDVDVHRRLIVRRRGEDLALLGGDGGVSFDQPGRDAAHGLDGQRQRGNVQKQDVACARVAGQFAALDGSAQSHAFVRI